MKRITKIEPARVQAAASKIRVAAYCRVSTETDIQLSSLETQKSHYEKLISANPDWEFAGLYYDEGISGTNKDKRPALLQMITDCETGKIDRILTKSLSRFARNTADCLELTRELLDLGVTIYFEKESINTLDAKGEVLLTIMASLAQQESQSISQNVRLGLQYRYQQGKVQVNTNRFLGYDKDKDGNLVINPEEAKVVRRIYREYLEGKSYYAIGKGLTADGIKTAAGNEYWLASTLRKILMNEKYIGDALLQKTVTTDFLTKKRVVNKGIAPQYYVEGSHEAIIPREIYMQVQEEIVRRARLRSDSGSRRVYSGKYAFSSRIYCGHCGDIFKRTQWYIRKERIPVWRCACRLDQKKNKSNSRCPSRTVYESDLHAAAVEAVNQLIAEKDDFMPGLRNAIEKAVGSGNAEKVAKTDEQIESLEKELLKRANTGKNYTDILEQLEALRDAKQELVLEDADNVNAKRHLAMIEAFLETQQTKIQEYDEDLVRKLLHQVTVYDDHLTFEFKSGLEVEISM